MIHELNIYKKLLFDFTNIAASAQFRCLQVLGHDQISYLRAGNLPHVAALQPTCGPDADMMKVDLFDPVIGTQCFEQTPTTAMCVAAAGQLSNDERSEQTPNAARQLCVS
eukprot:4410292-Heterocapsa_arctica.AAC.1